MAESNEKVLSLSVDRSWGQSRAVIGRAAEVGRRSRGQGVAWRGGEARRGGAGLGGA
jgi:hypothetical protein